MSLDVKFSWLDRFICIFSFLWRSCLKTSGWAQGDCLALYVLAKVLEKSLLNLACPCFSSWWYVIVIKVWRLPRSTVHMHLKMLVSMSDGLCQSFLIVNAQGCRFGFWILCGHIDRGLDQTADVYERSFSTALFNQSINQSVLFFAPKSTAKKGGPEKKPLICGLTGLRAPICSGHNAVTEANVH